MKSRELFLPALFAVLAAAGAPAADAAESSAAQFLKLGFGARALGMGEAYAAVADDAAALHYNPAGLAPGYGQGGRSAAFSHAWHIQDMGISQAAYVARPWGLAVTYFSAGELEGRAPVTGALTGNFTASDIAVSAGYGLALGRLKAGAAVKYIGQKIKDSSASAFAADAGLLYGLDGVPLTFGVSVSNFGTKIKFDEDSFPLPLVCRAGAAYRLDKTLLALQLDLPNDDGASLRLGAEYAPAAGVRLRLGYKTSSSADKDAILGKELGGSGSGVSNLYGFFAGLGLLYRDFSLDYALTPYGELGNAHRFSFAFRFE
ncbi:MAG: PorV/PorQ family protein [Elusimicrobiota bacterium]